MSTIRTIEGDFQHSSGRYAIVAGRFNSFIVDSLLAGALDTLRRHGVADEQITVVRAPATRDCDAVIALGAVIRGGTPHFEYVAGECVKGLSQISLQSQRPVAFGVLTVDTIEQAIERSGTKAGNKGAEAALSALEMLSVFDALDGEP